MDERELARNLQDMIVRGNAHAARGVAERLVGISPNLTLDAIINGLNIVRDLGEIKEYSEERINASRAAVCEALRAFKVNVHSKDVAFKGRVALGSYGSAQEAELELLSAALGLAGLEIINLASGESPTGLLRNAADHKVDVLVAYVNDDTPESWLEDLAKAIVGGNFQQVFETIVFASSAAPVALGNIIKGITYDLDEVAAKVTELLIAKRKSR
jgi:methanogenic corrinoid protein MtbC1